MWLYGDNIELNRNCQNLFNKRGGILHNKIIEDIEPFNEIHFYDCILHAIFPVINHFNRHIYPFLFKSKYRFDLNGSIYIDSLEREKIRNILNDMGIVECGKRISENIVSDIKQAINLNRPTIINLDCFYESIRDDAYMKNHYPHFFLIYGFDDNTNKFNIIEHKYKDSFIYAKRLIDYNDIVSSYNSGIEYLKLQNYGDTFNEYYVMSDFDYKKDNDSYFMEYLDYLNCNKEIFENNLKEFKNNIPEFINCITNYDNLENVIDQLNNIIQEKNKEKYILITLFQDFKELNILVEKIINEWIIIRGIIAKMKYSNDTDMNKINNIKIRKEEIYQKEIMLNNILFSIK